MNQKVLLIKPHYNANEKYSTAVFPLGLLCLSTSLKDNGYNPVIIDATVYGDYMGEIAPHLEDAVAVGITAMSAQVYSGCKIAEFIRKKRPGLPIIWGGVHPTLYPEDTVNSPLADIVVLGEGDETLVELLDCLKSGKPLREVKGIVYKSDGSISRSPDRPLLADMPSIDYSLLPQIDKYMWADLYPFRREKVRCVDLHAGRGCFYECTFCFENTSFKHRARSAEALVSDIISLKDKFGITMINIQDSDFFADKRRLIRFVDLMIEKNTGVEWFSNCRSNYF
ncbi:MAG: cobalamin-dependent protein, partial [Candidatus Omnitrophota bacterium]|nr:cobalamin-dependent protein [Candidatus Omnitrophota bacterium]